MVDIIVNNVPDITEWNCQKRLKLFRWQIVAKSFFSELKSLSPSNQRASDLKVWKSTKVYTMQKKTSDL